MGLVANQTNYHHLNCDSISTFGQTKNKEKLLQLCVPATDVHKVATNYYTISPNLNKIKLMASVFTYATSIDYNISYKF